MTEDEVRQFWDAHPCGEAAVGGNTQDYDTFFTRYDAFRYRQHSHLLKCLDGIDFRNKHVLEIGLGLGADSEQIIRRQARWSGIDLTPASVQRVRARLHARGLPYERLEVGSVCNLPFDSDTFDIVFSHGVLHHVPEIQKAQSEIARVLKPQGELIAMLYAKYSLNYLVAIALVRRLALAAAYLARIQGRGLLAQHLHNAKEVGIGRYLRMGHFIHRNTDGPLNPYSKVYSLSEVRRDFTDFRIVRSYKRFMHAPPLPVKWLPLERWLGWHLWVHLTPLKGSDD